MTSRPSRPSNRSVFIGAGSDLAELLSQLRRRRERPGQQVTQHVLKWPAAQEHERPQPLVQLPRNAGGQPRVVGHPDLLGGGVTTSCLAALAGLYVPYIHTSRHYCKDAHSQLRRPGLLNPAGRPYDDVMASDDELFGEMRKIVSSAIVGALAQAEGITDRDAAYRQLSWLADTFAAATTASGRGRAEVARQMKEAEGLSFAQLGQRLGVSRARAADMLRVSQARQPEAPPVAAAIVTSDRGVLAGRRNDNAPPWTFLAGEVEPGESAADAAVREVKEEAGIDVVVGRVLGRRVHPATNRTMIYMTARPT